MSQLVEWEEEPMNSTIHGTRRAVMMAASFTTLAFLIVGTARAESLSVYAWSGELPEEIVQDFTKETGIDVTLDTFDSNESLIAKLEAGASGYDVVNPSQYAVQIMAKKGLIQELDHAKIPNLKNLSEVFRNVSYDTGNKYSIPYIWGTTGLAYNSDCTKEPITSWNALWDEKYKGRVYMLDNMLAAYIAGLQVNGFDANSSNPDEIEKATQTLIAQKANLAGYNSTNFADLVASGEACIVQAWSGNIANIAAENPAVHFVVPDEGGTMWVDGYAVAKNAPNPEAAYKFLDYLMRPEVSAKVTVLTKIAGTNDAAKPLLPADVTGNAAVYPSDEKLAKADFILDVGEAMKLYQDGWTRVKTAE